MTCRFALALAIPAFLGLLCVNAAQDSSWGTVKGQITLGSDKLPAPQNLEAAIKSNNDAKHCLEKGAIFDEEWVVHPKSKGVANVFVWLGPEDPKKRTPLPVHPRLAKIEKPEVVMDQPCCKFVPHALALREGQALVAKNSSPVAHNFHYNGHPDVNPGENPLIAAKGAYTIKGLRADRLPIAVKCSFHPWMKGWVRVFNHPYFAVTDENGAFEIKDAPAGNVRLHIWHEGAGHGGWKEGQLIAVKPGQADEHKLILKP